MCLVSIRAAAVEPNPWKRPLIDHQRKIKNIVTKAKAQRWWTWTWWMIQHSLACYRSIPCSSTSHQSPATSSKCLALCQIRRRSTTQMTSSSGCIVMVKWDILDFAIGRLRSDNCAFRQDVVRATLSCRWWLQAQMCNWFLIPATIITIIIRRTSWRGSATSTRRLEK